MVRVSFRILLFLAVLAAGRAVIAGFVRVDEPNEVVVVVVTGGGCTSDAATVKASRED